MSQLINRSNNNSKHRKEANLKLLQDLSKALIRVGMIENKM